MRTLFHVTMHFLHLLFYFVETERLPSLQAGSLAHVQALTGRATTDK